MSSPIDQLQNYLLENPPQLDNLWEFEIRSNANSEFENNMHFLISDCTLPFNKLTYETAPNGEKYYTGIQYPDEFSVTVRETHARAADDVFGSARFLSWWDDWFNMNYDTSNEEFLSNAHNTEAYRTGTIKLLTQNVMMSPIVSQPIVRDVIQDNILLSIARGVTSRATGKAGVTSTLNIVSGIVGNSNISANLRPVTLRAPLGMSGAVLSDSEQVVTRFDLINLRPVGIEPVSLTYSDSKPLEYRMSLICDRMKIVKGLF